MDVTGGWNSKVAEVIDESPPGKSRKLAYPPVFASGPIKTPGYYSVSFDPGMKVNCTH